METPRQKKTALDRLMQVTSIAVILLVLSSVLGGIRSVEQNSPLGSQARLLQTTQSLAAAQPTATAGQVVQTSTGTGTSTAPSRASQMEQLAGLWPTWVLKSGREIQVPPPPGAQATAAELEVLRGLASQRDAGTRSTIQYWNAGSPSYRWVQLALKQLQEQLPSIPRANQAMAMLNVAVYDSMVTVWQAKYTYNRQRPAALAPDLAAIATPSSPSYPDEHAAAAGAASAILSFLYPEQAEEFAATAWEAAQTRVEAGVAFPSDVEAGLSLGQAVAERVIDHTGIRGASFAGSGIALWWNAPATGEPLSSPWRPWALAYAGEFLPDAPASGAVEATWGDLLRLQQVGDANASDIPPAALFWNSFAGMHLYWYDVAAQKMAQYHIDENPVQAARVYALMSIAHDDGANACWDAMYTYRVMRSSPIGAGEAPSLTPVTPYAYPSVQACLAGSMATVLAAVFPLDEQALRATGEEAAQAGLWVDGAVPDDVRAGLTLGRVVALRVLSHPLSWLWGDE